MKLENEHLMQNEDVLLSKKANAVIKVSDFGLSRFAADGMMWTIGMKGEEAIGGKLYLTNFRIIFISHKLNRVTGSFSVFLPSISNVANTSKGLKKSITLETALANFQFIVWGIPELLRQISQAQDALSKEKLDSLAIALESYALVNNDGMKINQPLEAVNKVFLFSKSGANAPDSTQDPLSNLTSKLMTDLLETLKTTT